MSGDPVNIVTIIALVAGQLANTVVSYFLKKDLSKVKKWQQKRDRRNILIFIVEDNEYDIEAIQTEVLSKIDNESKCFSDPVVLLDEMPDEPHVYIIDEHLPKLSGLEMAKLIKEKNKKNFVILNTGADTDEDTFTNYTEHNIERYVHKNSSRWAEALIKAINDGLDSVSVR